MPAVPNLAFHVPNNISIDDSVAGYPFSYSIVGIFASSKYYQMNEIGNQLKELYNRIPRRHTADNVKEMYSLLDDYEDILKILEAEAQYEKQVGSFFESLDPIRATIKKSNDNKASKKAKDVLFDEASGALKDSIEEAIQLVK